MILWMQNAERYEQTKIFDMIHQIGYVHHKERFSYWRLEIFVDTLLKEPKIYIRIFRSRNTNTNILAGLGSKRMTKLKIVDLIGKITSKLL